MFIDSVILDAFVVSLVVFIVLFINFVVIIPIKSRKAGLEVDNCSRSHRLSSSASTKKPSSNHQRPCSSLGTSRRRRKNRASTETVSHESSTLGFHTRPEPQIAVATVIPILSFLCTSSTRLLGALTSAVGVCCLGVSVCDA